MRLRALPDMPATRATHTRALHDRQLPRQAAATVTPHGYEARRPCFFLASIGRACSQISAQLLRGRLCLPRCCAAAFLVRCARAVCRSASGCMAQSAQQQHAEPAPRLHHVACLYRVVSAKVACCTNLATGVVSRCTCACTYACLHFTTRSGSLTLGALFYCQKPIKLAAL